MSDHAEPEEAESEGYFASVSDLMVGVLFVFLLMLTILALNYHDESTDLDAKKRDVEIAHAEAETQHQQASAERAIADAALAESRLQQKEAGSLRDRLNRLAEMLRRQFAEREKTRASLLQRLADGLQAHGVRFSLDTESGVLRLSDSVPFQTGRSDLTDTAARTVSALADVLAEALPCFTAVAVRQSCQDGDAPILEAVLVEGHTDRQTWPNMSASESQQRNDLLSTSRALTVFTRVRQLQPALDKLQNPSQQPLLGVSGYGERRPLPTALSLAEADLSQNRRIDLRFILATPKSDEMARLLEQIGAMQATGPTATPP